MKPIQVPWPAARTVIGAGLLALYAVPSWAHLGGGTASVEADRQVIRGASVATTSLQQYDVKQIDSAHGTVREYMSRDGAVFAVAWHGTQPPNLQQLFNGYFARYEASAAALASRPDARRHVDVQASDLIVHAVAYMRTYRGFAYVPSLLPAGVSLADLQ